ncbi:MULTISPECIES: hypothetical protein [Sporomusa]|uniref:hypothetical protein n=1 Tax=Sporomusa TaxID=2375 RepID=UPI003158684E
MIVAKIVKDGKTVTEKTIREYQIKLNKAFDTMVAEAELEYTQKEYVSLADLKRENKHV